MKDLKQFITTNQDLGVFSDSLHRNLQIFEELFSLMPSEKQKQYHPILHHLMNNEFYETYEVMDLYLFYFNYSFENIGIEYSPVNLPIDFDGNLFKRWFFNIMFDYEIDLLDFYSIPGSEYKATPTAFDSFHPQAQPTLNHLAHHYFYEFNDISAADPEEIFNELTVTVLKTDKRINPTMSDYFDLVFHDGETYQYILVEFCNMEYDEFVTPDLNQMIHQLKQLDDYKSHALEPSILKDLYRLNYYCQSYHEHSNVDALFRLLDTREMIMF